ncbi:MAG: tyrosine-type recombinase/integrase [Leptospira sp.]|nr:tyrosine-type recombinase/integrase [Leptospira sp.]
MNLINDMPPRLFPVNITPFDSRFRFAFPYPERIDLLPLARSLPGAKYHHESRFWSFSKWPELSHPIYRLINTERILIDPNILPEEFGLWEGFERVIRNRNYTARTYKSYMFWNRSFLRHCLCVPNFVTEKDLLDYQDYLIHKKAVKSRTVAALQSALLFYYKTVHAIHPNLHFPSIKKEKRLPEILNLDEVKLILNSPPSDKHKLILSVAYSAGLRVSEVVKIRISDIDFDRDVIQIKQAKGQKDRTAILSPRVKSDILSCIQNRKPSDWLFPSALNFKNHLSIRTAEKVFENAKKNCNINKKVSFHSLRHAFATHLYEKGIDIRIIQTLLGHESVRTTQIYTHVSKKKLSNVMSPYDDL